MSFDLARKVADCVLFEGYVLYPYRASARKNQVRWQFGVLVPPAYRDQDTGEWSDQRTECLLEPGSASGANPIVRIKVRFLQVQAKTVEEVVPGSEPTAFRPVVSLDVYGSTLSTWDEGVPKEVDATVSLGELPVARVIPLRVPGGREVEEVRDATGALVGRMVRQRWPISGVIRVAATPLEGPYGVVRLRVHLENTTEWREPSSRREDAVRRSLVGTHTLLGVTDAAFISLLDPPEWARPAAESCQNVRTWPVLIGDESRDVMLSAPITLYDYPAVAPESPGDMFDATEIDEILTLRTAALTEAEKREARGTDERAAAIIDRVDDMPPEIMERLHGTVRYLREVTGTGPAWSPDAQATGPTPVSGEPARAAPWWDPGQDASVSPESDALLIAGHEVARGSRVRLRPGLRRADAQDMFLDGRIATVEAVFFDVEDASYLAVTLADDPAADLHQWHGRFLYFGPDEVEPLDEPIGGEPSEPVSGERQP